MPRALAKRFSPRFDSCARLGCGIDIIELARFRRAVKNGGNAFLRRVFTKQELAYAKARKKTQLLHLAGRFAAKESIIKAMAQVNPRRVLAMNQIEIANDTLGRPHAVLHARGLGNFRAHVSLSHVKSVAVATAIVSR